VTICDCDPHRCVDFKTQPSALRCAPCLVLSELSHDDEGDASGSVPPAKKSKKPKRKKKKAAAGVIKSRIDDEELVASTPI
jgi:hypothetical protein